MLGADTYTPPDTCSLHHTRPPSSRGSPDYLSLFSFFALVFRRRKERGTQQEIRKINVSFFFSIPPTFSVSSSYSGHHNGQLYVKEFLFFLKQHDFLSCIMSIKDFTIPSRNSQVPFNVDKKYFYYCRIIKVKAICGKYNMCILQQDIRYT